MYHLTTCNTSLRDRMKTAEASAVTDSEIRELTGLASAKRGHEQTSARLRSALGDAEWHSDSYCVASTTHLASHGTFTDSPTRFAMLSSLPSLHFCFDFPLYL